MYEKAGMARTYLTVREGDDDSINIIGYYSLALKSVFIPKALNNNQRKKIIGPLARIYNQDDPVTTYLIGQLGRSMDYSQRGDGRLLLFSALDRILEARDIVGGRIALVETENHLIDYYESNGFSILESSEDDLTTLYRKLG